MPPGRSRIALPRKVLACSWSALRCSLSSLISFGGVLHHADELFRWFENTVNLNLHAKGAEVEAESLVAIKHDDAEAGCSNANILLSAACFLQINNAKATFSIALSILAWNSPSSCLSKNKFGSTLNDVQGGDAMKSHGFSCSHFLRAFLWPWSSDRSQGSQSSLLTVRSREKSALNRSFFAAVHMRGGEYISATSVWGLPKLRRSVRYKSL